MPLYIYRAVTPKGQVVRNRVEEMNRFMLLKKLKSNGLMPISVTQIQMNKKASKIIRKQKKNVESSDSVLKTVREQEIARNMKSKTRKFAENTKRALFSNIKITNRDIVIFTQNFYLLKKANFNNIHALSTIIETTENQSFRAILEDILLGVEAGENMYSTMEYYAGVFPPIYINMIKVGELSRIFNKSIGASSKISR
ncbi:MAG: type II secretion system F family protein [Clostridia bacterium]|nr:type II secretion system F family protein [Clostridia bacterium]